MNKIKLIYDVVKATKSKDSINGTLKVEALKSNVKVFSLNNEFAKDLVSGYTKAKIKTELDYEGKIVRHESCTEFNHGEGCHFRGIRHKHHVYHHFHKNHSGGLQGKMAKFLFMLKSLDDLEITEQEDQGLILKLDIKEIPEDIKELMCHRHYQDYCGENNKNEDNYAHGNQRKFAFLHDLLKMEQPLVKLNIRLNAKKEIEEAAFIIEGITKNDSGEKTDVKLLTDISFA